MPVIKWIRIFEKKYRLIVRCFCVDLPAVTTAKLSNIIRNTTNKYYGLCEYVIYQAALQERYERGFANGIEIDEAQFEARRKRGRDAGGKTIVLGLRKRNENVYADIISDVQRKTLVSSTHFFRQTVQSFFVDIVFKRYRTHFEC